MATAPFQTYLHTHTPSQGKAGDEAKAKDLTDGATLECTYTYAEGNLANLCGGGGFGGRRRRSCAYGGGGRSRGGTLGAFLNGMYCEIDDYDGW